VSRRLLPWERQGILVVVSLTILLSSFSLTFAAEESIEFMYLAGGESWEEAYRTLTDAFEAANPDVKVNRLRVQDGYGTRLVALIASGTVPDVLALDMHDIMSFGDERFLYDLNPFIRKTPEYQIKRVAPPLLDMYTVDGKLFAAPSSANPSLYVYNIDLFDRAGVAHPVDLYRADAWDWSAFRDMARKVTRKEADGRFSVVGASLHLPRVWIAANGGREFDDSKRPTQSFYDSQASIEAIEFIHSMIWQDEAMLPAGRIAGQVGANDVVGFAQGKVGMSSRWISYVPQFTQGASDVGLVPYPKGPTPQGRYATDLGSWGIAISQQTKHLDAAWRYVSYITGPIGCAIDAKMPGKTPPRPMHLGWLPAQIENPEIYPDLLVSGIVRVISHDRKNLQSIIDRGMNMVWANTVEPKSAASEITRQINAFLKQTPQ
jgi:multiple sugar transport system substrate-binding protein